MAKRKSGARKGSARRKKKGGRWKRLAALFILVAFALVLGCGYVCARVVHVSYVDAYIENLSPFLEGATVLFASDFKVTGPRSAAHAAGLMKSLSALKPDIVLLGGDYTAMSAFDLFRAQTQGGRDAINERLRQARMTFFSGISGLFAPGSVFAVGGDGDAEIGGLSEDCALGGAVLLEDRVFLASVNECPLYIVGLRDYLTGGTRSYKFRGPSSEDAVLVLCHNPDAYALAASVADINGNPLADLILAGHTLGGQARVFGKGLLSRAGVYDGKFLSGAYNEIGPEMLVSSGVGAQWLPLRVGTQAQAYFVTLHRK